MTVAFLLYRDSTKVLPSSIPKQASNFAECLRTSLQLVGDARVKFEEKVTLHYV